MRDKRQGFFVAEDTHTRRLRREDRGGGSTDSSELAVIAIRKGCVSKRMEKRRKQKLGRISVWPFYSLDNRMVHDRAKAYYPFFFFHLTTPFRICPYELLVLQKGQCVRISLGHPWDGN